MCEVSPVITLLRCRLMGAIILKRMIPSWVTTLLKITIFPPFKNALFGVRNFNRLVYVQLRVEPAASLLLLGRASRPCLGSMRGERRGGGAAMVGAQTGYLSLSHNPPLQHKQLHILQKESMKKQRPHGFAQTRPCWCSSLSHAHLTTLLLAVSGRGAAALLRDNTLTCTSWPAGPLAQKSSKIWHSHAVLILRKCY